MSSFVRWKNSSNRPFQHPRTAGTQADISRHCAALGPQGLIQIDSPWISWANFSTKELDLFIGMYVASYFTSVQDKHVDSSLCTHHEDSIWVQDSTTKTAESLMCPGYCGALPLLALPPWLHGA